MTRYFYIKSFVFPHAQLLVYNDDCFRDMKLYVDSALASGLYINVTAILNQYHFNYIALQTYWHP